MCWDFESLALRFATLSINLKVYRKEIEDFAEFDKTWGRSLKVHGIVDALKQFFFSGERVRLDVVESCISQVEKVLELMESQRLLRFFSSSLLFVYEGDEDAEPKPVVKMIDFAHAHPIKDHGRDDGYIIGLKNLIKKLKQLQE